MRVHGGGLSQVADAVLADWGDSWRVLVTGDSTGFEDVGTWETTDPTDRSGVGYDDSGWSLQTLPFTGFLNSSAWLRKTVTIPDDRGETAHLIVVWNVDNYADVYVDGVLVVADRDAVWGVTRSVLVPVTPGADVVVAVRADDDGVTEHPETDAASIDVRLVARCSTAAVVPDAPPVMEVGVVVPLLRVGQRLVALGTPASGEPGGEPATTDDYLFRVAPGAVAGDFGFEVTDSNGNVWRLRGSARESFVSGDWACALYRVYTAVGDLPDASDGFIPAGRSYLYHQTGTSVSPGRTAGSSANIGVASTDRSLAVILLAVTDPLTPPAMTGDVPLTLQDSFTIGGDAMQLWHQTSGGSSSLITWGDEEDFGTYRDYVAVTFSWT